MKSEGEGKHRKLVFRLDTDDLVMAGADHPLSFGRDADNPDPRLHVRGAIGNGLEARIDRALYYEIVEMALAEGEDPPAIWRSEEHTSELQSLMRISYAVFCLKKKKCSNTHQNRSSFEPYCCIPTH